MAPNAPAQNTRRRRLPVTLGVAGLLALVIGVTAAFGGLGDKPDGPVRAAPRTTVDQGLFDVKVLKAQAGPTDAGFGKKKNALTVWMHVANKDKETRSLTEFMDGVATEPSLAKYGRADFLMSTGESEGQTTTAIHPRMPIDVKLVWPLPNNTALRSVTVDFRKWEYGQSFTTDQFEWTVYSGSPIAAKVTLPVRAGGGS